jgi:hypothetical protein
MSNFLDEIENILKNTDGIDSFVTDLQSEKTTNNEQSVLIQTILNTQEEIKEGVKKLAAKIVALNPPTSVSLEIPAETTLLKEIPTVE